MVQAAKGNASELASRWPDGLLRPPRVTKVYICARQLEPPALSRRVISPRLELVLSGCYENLIEADNRAVTVRLTAGTALFAAPNCWNRPTWRHRVRLLSLLFGKKRIGIRLVSGAGAANPRVTARKFSLPRPLTGPLPKVLEAMVELQAAGGPVAALPELARALLCCLRESIRQPAPQKADPAKSLLEHACVFLQNHYQCDITRESVARQFAVSPNYLSRVFQARGRMTFSSYLMHVRTDRAKRLLRSYDLKLDDVAARCGYRDTAYFCRVFKRLVKMTAADYRAQYQPGQACN
jgi:AraC-like DNA-binding protein